MDAGLLRARPTDYLIKYHRQCRIGAPEPRRPAVAPCHGLDARETSSWRKPVHTDRKSATRTYHQSVVLAAIRAGEDPVMRHLVAAEGPVPAEVGQNPCTSARQRATEAAAPGPQRTGHDE